MSEPDEIPHMTVEQMDDLLQQLNYQELHHVRTTVSERMKEMRDTGITQLRATIAEQAKLLGVEIKDLVPKKTRKKRKQKEDDDTEI